MYNQQTRKPFWLAGLLYLKVAILGGKNIYENKKYP